MPGGNDYNSVILGARAAVRHAEEVLRVLKEKETEEAAGEEQTEETPSAAPSGERH